MIERLTAYLAAACDRRQGWGVFDCCLFMADWVREVRGIDPAGAHRGAYSTPEEAAAILRQAGGLRALAVSLAARAGLSERSGHPQPGDVGVVVIRGVEVGAIYATRGWAMLTLRGPVVVEDAPHLIAWEV